MQSEQTMDITTYGHMVDALSQGMGKWAKEITVYDTFVYMNSVEEDKRLRSFLDWSLPYT